MKEAIAGENVNLPKIIARQRLRITAVALRAPDPLRLAEKSRWMIEDCEQFELVERRARMLPIHERRRETIVHHQAARHIDEIVLQIRAPQPILRAERPFIRE